jgi:hypothetical protein
MSNFFCSILEITENNVLDFLFQIFKILSRVQVVASRKSTLQNSLEASRSFVTFLSLPFLKVVTADWLIYG